MTWFRGVIQSAKDTAKGVMLLNAMGRGVRELQDVALLQQRGFVSVPVAGDVAMFLQAGDLVVAVSTGSTDRPQAKVGETVVYSGKECFIRIMPDGSVHVKAKKIVLGSDDPVANPLDGIVTRSCLCSFTGAPHPDSSTAVFAKKVSA